MGAGRKRGWKMESRDALGIVALALFIIIIRMLFTPAPIVLPAPQSIAPESSTGARPYLARTYPTPTRTTSVRPTLSASNNGELFIFDPNTLDSTGFLRLGFSASQAQSILKYRVSGAVFRKPEDFSRSYVVSESMYQRLAPYIQIKATQPQPQNRPQVQERSQSETLFRIESRPQQEQIEINSADTSLLKRLRGIGPYYAQRIVQYRNRLGGFVAVEQLMEIEGIDTARFESMAPQIQIDFTLIRKIDLKTADQATLGQHPYIGPYAARWIVHFREQLGDTVCTLPSLVRRNIIKAQQSQWFEYYIQQ